jgi:hypothetical protein
MPDSDVAGKEILTSAGVSIDGIYNQPLDKIDVTATPTLLLIDSDGHVTKSWIGLLDSSGQRKVLAASLSSIAK